MNRVITVRFSREAREWQVVWWTRVVASHCNSRGQAITSGREMARMRRSLGERVRLRVYDKAGRISFEQWYGPARRRSSA